MRTLFRRITCLTASCLLAASASATFGQAYVTAHRTAEIAPFAAASYVSPDWGSSNNFGYTLGVDYTPFVPVMPLLLQPSFELRMTSGSGPQSTERSYAGGFKLAATVHHVHPYATFLEGFGYIYFANPQLTSAGLYSQDESHFFALGGGVEYDVTSTWQVRVDYSQQHWDLKPPVMTPTNTSIGFTYRIPFGSSRPQIR